MRLIDADSIQEELAALILYSAGTPEGECVDYAHNLIDEQPTVDAEPVKHAHWIEFRTNSGNVHYKCSRCGKEVSYPYAKKRWKYCIECGARMDAEREENK